MDESTRRNFLVMAGVGAAAAAGAAVVATTAGGTSAEAATTPSAAPAGTGPLVAYVQDPGSGRVAVMVGETEVVVHDPDLVARLAAAAAGRKV